MKSHRFLAATTLVLACSATPVLAQLRSELVVGGLSFPVGFVQDPSQPGVRMVVQQGGRIRVVQDGALRAEDFLNISSEVMHSGERGLLGLAFAPDYGTSGRFYVHFTNLAGNTVIARFQRDAMNPLRADPFSRFDLVWPDGLPFLQQPFENHKGGNLVFGPDGYLYVGLGDGGDQNDPFHLAQNPEILLGKMLRIDVSVDLTHPTGYVVPATNPFVGQPGILGEIWAFGLRNPWRYSFDDPSRGGTGALIIADVGQAAFEEVDYEPAGRGGRNYGWRNREGAHDNVLTLPPYPIPLTDPIFEYSHDIGRSITGGFVYRGGALGGGYTGRYFFADIIRNRVWSIGLAIDGSGEATPIDIAEHTSELGTGARSISSFGIDANGELYTVSYGRGEVYRIAFDGTAPPPPPPPPPTSCTTPSPGFGWVCHEGNWYPPGMPIPGQPPVDPPTDPPVDPPPVDPPPTDPPPDPPVDPPVTPPAPPTGCPTVQPGPDWTCFGGQWYPPGMPIPGLPAPPPPPPPEPTPAPPGDDLPPPPAPPPSTCETVQPGPDWVCVNGNWYPPGMELPGVTPGPPGPPPPTPTSGECLGPDPFIGIPGLVGICVDGNWIPVEGLRGTGTVRFQTLEFGYWTIQVDDGRVFAVEGLPSEFEIDGLRVTFSGRFILVVAPHGPFLELISIAPIQ